MNLKTKTSHGAWVASVCSSAIVAALGLSVPSAQGAAIASDTAANYTSTWGTTPPNSGSGFGPWNITVNNGNNPPYVGTYLYYTSYNDAAGTAISSGGNAWATYANQGNNNGSIDIARPFTAGASGSTSLFDQTFSADLSSDGVGDGNGGPPNSDLGISVGSAFDFQYPGTGSDNFLLSVDGASPIVTPVNFSELNSGLAISLAVSGALNSPTEDYTFSVSPVSGGPAYYSLSGTFDSSAYNTSAFGYVDENTTGNAYFNNLNITAESPAAAPDSSSLALEIGAVTLAMGMIRRK